VLRDLRTIAVTALAPVVWGSTYLVTSEHLPPGRPLFAACVRALPAGVLLVLLARRLPHGVWWWRSAVLGFLNIGAFFALLFVAAYRLPGGVAATVIALQPLLVAALSARLLAQRLSRRTVLAALAGIGGVAAMVLSAEARLDPAGLAAALGAAVVMATGVVLSKRWSPPVSATAFAGWQLCAGGLLLLPVAVLVEGASPPPLTTAGALGYAYLGLVGAALAYVVWFRGIRVLAPTAVTFLGLLSPVVATALGWLVLDQDLSPVQVVGAAVVLGSIVVGQRPSTDRSAGPGAPPRGAPAVQGAVRGA
jgi:probable blue pigment (indigoidine) exporter